MTNCNVILFVGAEMFGRLLTLHTVPHELWRTHLLTLKSLSLDNVLLLRFLSLHVHCFLFQELFKWCRLILAGSFLFLFRKLLYFTNSWLFLLWKPSISFRFSYNWPSLVITFKGACLVARTQFSLSSCFITQVYYMDFLRFLLLMLFPLPFQNFRILKSFLFWLVQRQVCIHYYIGFLGFHPHLFRRYNNNFNGVLGFWGDRKSVV